MRFFLVVIQVLCGLLLLGFVWIETLLNTGSIGAIYYFQSLVVIFKQKKKKKKKYIVVSVDHGIEQRHPTQFFSIRMYFPSLQFVSRKTIMPSGPKQLMYFY